MKRLLPIALILSPVAAQAHSGHAATISFFSGVAHPLGGMDHLLAMLAVGIWASQIGGRAVFAVPFSFLVAMLAGSHFATHLPLVEPMLLASVIVLGALVALRARARLSVALALVAAFGAVHGAAHGIEAPALGQAGYAAGFAVSTAALHLFGLGLGLGAGLRRVMPQSLHAIGAAMANRPASKA
jgi:urease accessory protein